MQTKTELIQAITERHSDKLTRKDVKGVLESLASVGYKELRKSGEFVVPGFAKLIVIKKPAMTFKAKSARKVLKARAVKAAKDCLV
jgi:DNA-binding protein HU-beta